MAGMGHNSAVIGDALREIVERAEQLAEEKADIAAQEKDLFAEAKGQGYDTKIIRKLLAIRKREKEYAEEQELLALYGSALGMGVFA
jgi:uncharacterized protein (UPF0335 family)